ncbi:class I SAM-dependent methyltransferase [Paenibacillus sp.]|uniref:class I SAM-dependent methyltransferase n=1 Tax=Paenibacillus sp. TaxID=58172 RepID=UPI002D3A33AF|nr:class I SAM-dependent methyltransferase [Paenibacillus sp.]HZG55505.1 class I SAM-dependent methyltransferase [Paenibacillus sp.]
MSDHYYSKTPTTPSQRQTIDATLRGQPVRFVTEAGVFSKREVDFGSRLLIETMIVPRDADVLDVGCGYGPIGLVAARLAAEGTVTMVDVNERAVNVAKENAERLGVKNVRILQSDLFEALPQDATFDVVLTNPPIRAGKSVVHRIFEGAYERLRSGGSLWVVIQKKQGAPSAFEKLETLFGDVREETKEKGYRIFRAIKQN